MLGLTFMGIKNGSSSIGTPSIRNHYRAIDNDFGIGCSEHYVRLDNVESNVGTSNNTSNIRSFLLPCSQDKRKD
jgi:hypothetical protein